MIMQAFLMSELQLEQQIPFSASLTFEQSYSEVWMAIAPQWRNYVRLSSALANVPVNQNITLPAPVDQFGRARNRWAG